jgi:CRISPR-associated protein Cas5t
MRVIGCLNSFRQPDFHTYHKTLPLPPKTTIAGMIGSALGISPKEVNDEWLKKDRFRMGIVGKANGKANDLWQIRKYESKQIAAYKKGTEITPYKTAVIVRELLYACEYYIYLQFSQDADYAFILEKLQNPAWALSLGREDELIKIVSIQIVELEEKEGVFFRNTCIAFNTNENRYQIDLKSSSVSNLLAEAPKSIKLPIAFSHRKDSEVREAEAFQDFTFVSDLAIKPESSKGYFDEEWNHAFQVF